MDVLVMFLEIVLLIIDTRRGLLVDDRRHLAPRSARSPRWSPRSPLLPRVCRGLRSNFNYAPTLTLHIWNISAICQKRAKLNQIPSRTRGTESTNQPGQPSRQLGISVGRGGGGDPPPGNTADTPREIPTSTKRPVPSTFEPPPPSRRWTRTVRARDAVQFGPDDGEASPSSLPAGGRCRLGAGSHEI